MPGEAAAFFVVETLASAEARGAAIPATIEAAATAIEPVTVDADDVGGVCDASGLTSAARRVLAALPDGGERIGLVAGDLNGEPYRSEEYAYLVARALAGVKTPFRLWHPADAIGDTGAASAALSIAVAARALHRGYARTDDALVFASSDGGLRGTVVLRRHTSSKPKGG
jgi:3-oxoacyl-[acyl-carrier-protein] synthase-1